MWNRMSWWLCVCVCVCEWERQRTYRVPWITVSNELPGTFQEYSHIKLVCQWEIVTFWAQTNPCNPSFWRHKTTRDFLSTVQFFGVTLSAWTTVERKSLTFPGNLKTAVWDRFKDCMLSSWGLHQPALDREDNLLSLRDTVFLEERRSWRLRGGVPSCMIRSKKTGQWEWLQGYGWWGGKAWE